VKLKVCENGQSAGVVVFAAKDAFLVIQRSSSVPSAAAGPLRIRAAHVAIVLLALSFTHGQPAVVRAAEPVRQPAKGKGVAPAKPAPAKPAPAAKPAAGASGGASQIPPAKLAMPQVVFSDAHAKTCLVKVGDALPAMQLKDLAGKPQTLAALLGKRLTVVLFWHSANSYAVEELADLGPDIGKPFADAGVRLIAIDERDPAEKVAALVKKLGVTFPVLLDSDGKALAAVATRRLPRTYLLDDQGKILWFDIEYSASTRRQLRDAIRVTLSGEG
jgi:peroxiredoxin